MIRRNEVFGYLIALSALSALTGSVATILPSKAAYGADTPLGAAAAPAASPTSPEGLWKTFDDKTGNARAIVRIYVENGKLFGRIMHSFTPGAEQRVCARCTDERKDQPIIGLLIIRNMAPDHDDYSGGDILDPESGSVYRCKLHLEHDGSVLSVRGYIGISLLGRTQTWQRQPDVPGR